MRSIKLKLLGDLGVRIYHTALHFIHICVVSCRLVVGKRDDLQLLDLSERIACPIDIGGACLRFFRYLLRCNRAKFARNLLLLVFLQDDVKWTELLVFCKFLYARLLASASIMMWSIRAQHRLAALVTSRLEKFCLVWVLKEALSSDFAYGVFIWIFPTRDAKWVYEGLLFSF